MTDDPTSGLHTPVRNRYFFGKLLDAQHLQLEQDYHSGKRALVNRLIVGTGVAVGLAVTVSPAGGITISPGVAIDPSGREIVVPDPVDVDPRQPTDDTGQPSGSPLEGTGTVWVAVVSADRATEPVPVFANSDDGELASAPSVVEECFAFVVSADSTPGVALAQVHLGDAGAPLAAGDVDTSVRQAVPTGADMTRLLAAVERVLSGYVLGYLRGDAQTQDPATVLETPLSVSVTDATGAPAAGVAVTFAVRGGAGQVSIDGKTFAESVDAATGKDGAATAQWQLGAAPGLGSVAAGIPGAAPVTFVALAVPATAPSPKPRARTRAAGKPRNAKGSA